MHPILSVLTLLLCSAPQGPMPPGPERDPLVLYPENYRILFENDQVRVLDFRLRRGAAEETHEHPRHVAVFLTDVKIEFTLPDGSRRLREARAGDVAYSEPTAHASRNLADADAHGILVELKQSKGEGLVEPVPVDVAGKQPRAAARPITAVTLIHGLPGRAADLRHHLLSLSAPTRAEQGCLQYDLYQSARNPEEFLRLEAWASAAALEAHKQTPHLRASFEKRQREGWTTEIMVFENSEEEFPLERLDPRLDALLPPGTRVERIVEGNVWSEGPVWDAERATLLFSDVPRNAVYRWSETGGVTEFLARSGYTGEQPFAGAEPGSNGLAFDAAGRLLICQHGDRRIVRREANGSRTVLADRFQGKRLNSPNDLILGPDGDLYFTDPPFGLPRAFEDPEKELDVQGVYRLRGDGELTLVVGDLEAPNGLGFSPDGRTLYVSNARHARPVWMAYPVRPDGSVAGGRVFADASAYVTPDEGVPDGLEVDRHGNVFAAGPGGVHVYAPDGTRLGRIVTGVKTGNVCFGEDGTLYIAASHWILRAPTTTGAIESTPRR